MKRWLILITLFIAPVLRAHIGSPAVVFDGTAGPYPIRVIILPPPVVPGRAEINVRLLRDEPDPVKVTVLPVNAQAGLTGAPPPDDATPVAGDRSLRHAELWLMTSGSYAVHVAVSGKLGAGTVIVPVVSVATRRLGMSVGLTVVLAALGLLLFAGAVLLVTVGVRDSVSSEDSLCDARQRRRGRIALVVAFLLFGGAVYGGKSWWDREDRDYRNNRLYRPLPLNASYAINAGLPALTLDVPPTEGWPRDLKLIPDHGKLMHLFMIREPQLDALAHLHPVRSGKHTFTVVPPPLPPGRYRLYADITHESGFAATLTGTIDLPELPKAASSGASRDVDDSWSTLTPDQAQPLAFSGPKDIRAGEDVVLSFAAGGPGNQPIELEPYMGMLGHAAVRRSDGTVFAHLHPVGTISMASQAYFTSAAARQTGMPEPMDHRMHHMPAAASSVSFPYLFPQAGAYRIWLQTKSHGEIMTSVFDITVLPPR